jgi:hypothetical protein
MLILKKKFKPVFFIHIPRTGGRFLRELLRGNDYILNFTDFSQNYLNKEIPHLHYPFYNKFNNFGNTPQFLIVRNPMDRFMSMFNASIIKDNLNIDTDKILNDKKLLYEYIQEQITSFNYQTNWFLPQYFYINSKCKIWKYENGLGLNFFKWLKKEFKINIIKKNIFNNYTNLTDKAEYDEYKKIKINKKTKLFLKEYYQLDFKLFNYK